jgi:hypothetical protein
MDHIYDDCKEVIKGDDFIRFKEVICYAAEYGDLKIMEWLSII